MSLPPITPHPEITALRLLKYQQFRDSLNMQDRAALDAKISRWHRIMIDNHNGCGILSVQELFIALQEFEAEREVK